MIREYSRNHHQWKWVLKTIQKELDEMFIFTHPVREDYLVEYIQDFLTNDRYRWKQHWLESNGGQHESCPDAALCILEPYWKSMEGRTEAQKMKEKRSLVGKRSRSAAGLAPEPSDQVLLYTHTFQFRFPCKWPVRGPYPLQNSHFQTSKAVFMSTFCFRNMARQY
jgi:hypothetical protein